MGRSQGKDVNGKRGYQIKRQLPFGVMSEQQFAVAYQVPSVVPVGHVEIEVYLWDKTKRDTEQLKVGFFHSYLKRIENYHALQLA